jgi:hypothetical protein
MLSYVDSMASAVYRATLPVVNMRRANEFIQTHYCIVQYSIANVACSPVHMGDVCANCRLLYTV